MEGGQARVAGIVSRTVTIGGETYTLSQPRLVGMYGQMEAHLLSKRTDPLVVATRACQLAPEGQHAAIWAAAVKQASAARVVTASEMAEFENSVYGQAFKFWLCLAPEHRVKGAIDSVEKALALLELAGDEKIPEIMATVSVVSQEADLGN